MNVPVFLLKFLELELDARLSPEALARQRQRKFRRLVRFVKSRSPYYSRIIKQRGIDVASCLPGDFPVLTKSLLMEHFDEIATRPGITKDRIAEFLTRSKDPRDLYEGRYVVLHTSGSSGEIGYFVYSDSDWSRGFAQFSRLHPFAFRQRRAAYFGATQGHFAGITQFLTSGNSFLRLLYHPRAFEINGPLQPVIDGLNALQPHVLSGYPSGLAVLAGKQLAGELRIAPTFIETGGEPLGPEARSVIEKAFPAAVLNLYSSTEHMLMAVGDRRRGCLYLLEDDLIFEMHRDHTCVTNLFNRTLPLIRYRMEDVLDPLPACRGVLPFRAVKDIVGRMEHAPVFTNRRGTEDFISPIILVEFHVRHLRRFQVQVLGRTSFLFRAVLDEGLDPAGREEVLRNIRAKLREILVQKEMDNVTFEIEEVGDLAVDPKTGKFRLIVP